MDLSTKVLGTSIVHKLQEQQKTPVLTIGKDKFDRAALAKVACFNFTAARNLSTILNRELNVKNCKDVFDRIPPESLVLPRLGAVSLAVLGAAFEYAGIGGDAPLEAWMRRHHENGVRLVTFDSMKSRDAQEQTRENKTRKERKASRRNKAQRLRVDRFTNRANGEGAVNV